jgi:hypothetical protein
MSVEEELPTGWQQELLATLGAPATDANMQFFSDWFVAEHGASGETGGYDQGGGDNPFDTALPEPGSTNYNDLGGGQGVQSYSDWAQGEEATASTLEQSNMAPILAALKSGTATVPQLEAAEGSTPWGQESGWPSGAQPATGAAASGGGAGGVASKGSGIIGAAEGLMSGWESDLVADARNAFEMFGGLALIALGVYMLMKDLTGTSVGGAVRKAAHLPKKRARRKRTRSTGAERNASKINERQQASGTTPSRARKAAYVKRTTQDSGPGDANGNRGPVRSKAASAQPVSPENDTVPF